MSSASVDVLTKKTMEAIPSGKAGVSAHDEKKTRSPTFALIVCDLETRGHSYHDHGILSIGWAYLRLTMDELSNMTLSSLQSSLVHRIRMGRVSLLPMQPNQTYSPSTKQFWDQFPDVRATLEAEAIDYTKGITMFFSDLVKMQQSADAYVMIGDNLTFDYGLLNQALGDLSNHKQSIWMPLSASSAAKHCPPRDWVQASERLYAMRCKNSLDGQFTSFVFDQTTYKTECEAMKKWGSNHTHLPDDDSKSILLRTLLRMLCMKSSSSQASAGNTATTDASSSSSSLVSSSSRVGTSPMATDSASMS